MIKLKKENYKIKINGKFYNYDRAGANSWKIIKLSQGFTPRNFDDYLIFTIRKRGKRKLWDKLKPISLKDIQGFEVELYNQSLFGILNIRRKKNFPVSRCFECRKKFFKETSEPSEKNEHICEDCFIFMTANFLESIECKNCGETKVNDDRFLFNKALEKAVLKQVKCDFFCSRKCLFDHKKKDHKKIKIFYSKKSKRHGSVVARKLTREYFKIGKNLVNKITKKQKIKNVTSIDPYYSDLTKTERNKILKKQNKEANKNMKISKSFFKSMKTEKNINQAMKNLGKHLGNPTQRTKEKTKKTKTLKSYFKLFLIIKGMDRIQVKGKSFYYLRKSNVETALLSALLYRQELFLQGKLNKDDFIDDSGMRSKYDVF